MSNVVRIAFSIGAVALFAGCGGSQPPIGAPGAMPQVSALAVPTKSAKYKIVYSFRGMPDGASPLSTLIDVDGTFYGTTESGGTPATYYDYCAAEGCGTVFSVTPSGKEKVLHAFANTKGDGLIPYAGLIDVGGRLYGTTSSGGYACDALSYYGGGCGTVFSITPRGTEKVLHAFGGSRHGPDGQAPRADLIEVNGTLYGTTLYGGAIQCTHYYFACGTVFSITPGGKESVLHSFNSWPDGRHPVAGLIDVNGTLYGTTPGGGKRHNSPDGYGTVFSISTSGTEKVLYTFRGYPKDGRHPEASLMLVNGKLYGTTAYGGAYRCLINDSNVGCGTVFSITLGGREKVLHSFGESSKDGATPTASLIKVNGKLYGTTCGCRGYGGGGTIFSITTSGTEEVLHNFGRGSDGANPSASLIDVNGTLYGTTANGGANGWGTVFALTP